MAKSKRIPIAAAKELGLKYEKSQVILMTWDSETGEETIVTWGKTLKDCDQAAKGGNLMKKTLGWPEKLCNAVPARAKPKTTN